MIVEYTSFSGNELWHRLAAPSPSLECFMGSELFSSQFSAHGSELQMSKLKWKEKKRPNSFCLQLLHSGAVRTKHNWNSAWVRLTYTTTRKGTCWKSKREHFESFQLTSVPLTCVSVVKNEIKKHKLFDIKYIWMKIKWWRHEFHRRSTIGC